MPDGMVGSMLLTENLGASYNFNSPNQYIATGHFYGADRALI